MDLVDYSYIAIFFFLQGYFWDVDCLAYYSTLLCASWRLTSWKTRQGKEYTTVNPSQAKVDG